MVLNTRSTYPNLNSLLLIYNDPDVPKLMITMILMILILIILYSSDLGCFCYICMFTRASCSEQLQQVLGVSSQSLPNQHMHRLHSARR